MCFQTKKKPIQNPKKRRVEKNGAKSSKKVSFYTRLQCLQMQNCRIQIKLIEQLKEFEAAIESNKRNEIYAKCLIGRNLVLLQKKKKKGAQFIKFVRKHMTSYSPSMIYFLMKLYNVTQDYNRLMYVTLGIGELKTNFKLIVELVAEETSLLEKSCLTFGVLLLFIRF